MSENSFTIEVDIRIDKNGTWYYEGAEMIRKDIVDHFYHHLKKDETGRYLIEIGKERCYPVVEDTPFVIKAIRRTFSEEKGEDVIYLIMPDDTLEILDPSTLRIGDENVIYCQVFEAKYEARFSRAGYYQLAEHIEHDHEKDLYYISLNGQLFYLKGKE
jgi:uncharacterized protein